MTISSSAQITPHSQFTQVNKCKTNTFRDENKKRNQGYDPQYTRQTPENKRLVTLGSHKRAFQQTPQLYCEVASGDNSTSTGDQLPFNNTRAKSTRQLCVKREEAFNHKNNNHILEQIQLNNETSTSEDSVLEDPQLPIPHTNIVLGPPNKENKKNVQFQNPINDRGQGNSANGFYDPILITPRHPYSNSPSGVSSHEPIKDPLPDPPLKSKRKVFLRYSREWKRQRLFWLLLYVKQW